MHGRGVGRRTRYIWNSFTRRMRRKMRVGRRMDFKRMSACAHVPNPKPCNLKP